MYAARVLSSHVWYCSMCLQRDLQCVSFEQAESYEWESTEA